MAKTIRYLTLSLALTLGLASLAPATVLTGVDMVSTSGTLRMRHLQSAEARLSDDERHLIADDLTLEILLSNGEYAHAESNVGLVVLSGWKPSPEQAVEFDLNPETVGLYGREFRQRGIPGDILLEGREEKTRANFGPSGLVSTDMLIWADWLQLYILPTTFEQKMTFENGSKLNVSGACAIISQDMTDWKYYGENETSAKIVYERPLEDAE